MKITGKTKVIGIIGWPVSHSLSPVMHNAAFEYLGLDFCYVPFAVREGSLDVVLRAIPALNIVGLNVTVPHKEHVLPFLSEVSKEAAMMGAVNTIKVADDRLIGYNTDGIGFISAVEEAGHPVKGLSLLILGAGGAAKAVVFAVAGKGAKEITIANMTFAKAKSLKEQTEKYFHPVKIEAIGMGCDELKNIARKIDMIINTTSLGLKRGDPSPIPKEFLHNGLFICDLIYNPPETELIRDAKDSGINHMNGMGMLLHQGGAAFKLWTDTEPPIEVMRKALEETLMSNEQ